MVERNNAVIQDWYIPTADDIVYFSSMTCSPGNSRPYGVRQDKIDIEACRSSKPRGEGLIFKTPPRIEI